MSTAIAEPEIQAAQPSPVEPAAPHRRSPIAAVLHGTENAVLCAALFFMIVLPLAEAALRTTVHISISGAAAIVQHLGLIVGMVGGMVAARHGRLLALSTIGDNMFKGT